ncbi:hypothetical protein AnigIFM59636_010471 [Aspergillus niger]|nr:hypothetical protein AnigIFM59636_010471 [Aspergillus niger]
MAHVITTEAFVPLLEKAALPLVVFVSSALGSCTGRLDPNDQFAAFRFPAYRSTKVALNMGSKGWKVNASDPRHYATNFNGFRGSGSPESGALQTVRLASLDKDRPTVGQSAEGDDFEVCQEQILGERGFEVKVRLI